MFNYILLILTFITHHAFAESPILFSVEESDHQHTIVKVHITKPWILYGERHNEYGLPILIQANNKNITQHITLPEAQEQTHHDTVYKGYDADFHIILPNNILQHSNTINILGSACADQCVKVEQTLTLPQAVNNNPTLPWLLLGALLGGLILNFMPCVLPVICLKANYLLKLPHATKRRQLLWFMIIGIYTSFIIFASIVIVLKLSEYYLGWGEHFQSPYFLLAMLLICLVFAKQLLTGQNILQPILHKLPTGNTENTQAFLHGLFAAIMATPCTAPFLSSSVAIAWQSGPLMIMAIYLLIATGFAAPYLLLCWRSNFLPKPGKWLVYMNYLNALLLLGTALWLLIVIYQQTTLQHTIVFTMLAAAISYGKRLWVFISILIIWGGVAITEPYWQSTKDISVNWEIYTAKRVEEALANNQTILIDVTASWCLTCQFNKIALWQRADVLNLLHEKNVLLLRADMTNRNIEASRLLKKYQQSGIPFNLVLKPEQKPIILPVIISKQDLLEAL